MSAQNPVKNKMAIAKAICEPPEPFCSCHANHNLGNQFIERQPPGLRLLAVEWRAGTSGRQQAGGRHGLRNRLHNI
jgi:hypothetical protein